VGECWGRQTHRVQLGCFVCVPRVVHLFVEGGCPVRDGGHPR